MGSKDDPILFHWSRPGRGYYCGQSGTATLGQVEMEIVLLFIVFAFALRATAELASAMAQAAPCAFSQQPLNLRSPSSLDDAYRGVLACGPILAAALPYRESCRSCETAAIRCRRRAHARPNF